MFKLNKNGFTLVEVIFASLLTIILIGIMTVVLKPQMDNFSREKKQGIMEANGRGIVDYLGRGVQNAGYNITRGPRFLAASDHYLSTVFDEDDDGVIQNDEIFTYVISNSTSSPEDDDEGKSFIISPYFDFDDNGQVDQDETRDYEINLSLANPPFNLYLFTLNKTNANSLKNTVARNIDNLIIRYYDKNDEALPEGVESNESGTPIPPYNLSKDELNKIRKVEIEVLVRSKEIDPNANYLNNGSYAAGSVATQTNSISYSDRYRRKSFKLISAPRNLSTAPFGKIAMSANPTTVNCPETKSVITTSVVDAAGESVSEPLLLRFNTSIGTINPETISINSGEVFATLNYEWITTSSTATISANTEIDIEGKNIVVFNAIPVAFEGDFSDSFDLIPKSSWSDVVLTSDPDSENDPLWLVENDKYKLKSSGNPQINLNGCSLLKNYKVVVNIQKLDDHNTGDFFALVLRSQASSKLGESLGFYSAEIVCFFCNEAESANHRYLFRIVERNAQLELVKTLTSINLEPEEFPFIKDENYTLKANVIDDKLIAKFWKSNESEPADEPDATPGNCAEIGSETKCDGRTIVANVAKFDQGYFGLATNSSINTFDNVVQN